MASIGDDISEVDTPAVLVDMDLVEQNIRTLFSQFAKLDVRVRPHAKTVKSPVFAQMFLDAGAIGVCVAKLSEAEIMVANGIEDILITTEIAGAPKVHRLMRLLQHHSGVKVVVDSKAGADALNLAAAANALRVPVLIEINVGQNRAGVEPGLPALELARHILTLKYLQLLGVQGYEGHLQMIADRQEQERLCQEAMEKLVETVELLRCEGFSLKIVTTGGTGTALFCSRIPQVTELQPGSFVFWDVAYRNTVGTKYANALTVVSTVISKPTEYKCVVDAGMKSLSTDSGNAEVKNYAQFGYRPGGDEHGIIESAEHPLPFAVGDRLELIPSHIDTTTNLHDTYYCHRNGVLTGVYDIAARGKVQ